MQENEGEEDENESVGSEKSIVHGCNTSEKAVENNLYRRFSESKENFG